MRTKLFFLMVLLLLNIGLAAYAQQDLIEVPATEIVIYSDDFEMIVEDLECIGGGPPSTTCSIGASATVEFDCSVSCPADYYACCGIKGCHCKPIRVNKESH